MKSWLSKENEWEREREKPHASTYIVNHVSFYMNWISNMVKDVQDGSFSRSYPCSFQWFFWGIAWTKLLLLVNLIHIDSFLLATYARKMNWYSLDIILLKIIGSPSKFRCLELKVYIYKAYLSKEKLNLILT